MLATSTSMANSLVMRKILVSVAWVVLGNVAFTALYVALTLQFNPSVTHDESYEFGNSYGAYFFLLSVVLVIYLAMTNRLPGGKSARSK